MFFLVQAENDNDDEDEDDDTFYTAFFYLILINGVGQQWNGIDGEILALCDTWQYTS